MFPPYARFVYTILRNTLQDLDLSLHSRENLKSPFIELELFLNSLCNYALVIF